MISKRRLLEAAKHHADAVIAVESWYAIAMKANWTCLEDVRRTYSHADPVGTCTVFNIKGNRYRLVVKIFYRGGQVYFKRLLTHAEYSKENWKHECATV